MYIRIVKFATFFIFNVNTILRFSFDLGTPIVLSIYLNETFYHYAVHVVKAGALCCQGHFLCYDKTFRVNVQTF
jgi:hypothetical protein